MPPEVIDNDTQQVLAPAAPPASARPIEARAAVALRPDDLLALAVQRGDGIDVLERLMALKERVDAASAKAAFDEDFAAFKATCMEVIRGTTYSDGPLKGKKYADLSDVVATATANLSKHGLSASWKPLPVEGADDKTWVRVACVLRHVGGHSEQVEFGGPVDTGPGRSPIQARKSSVTYLERITFLMVTGLAEADADDDGAGGPAVGPETALMMQLIAEAQQTTTDQQAATCWKENNKKLAQWPYAFEKFKQAVAAHRNSLKAKVPA